MRVEIDQSGRVEDLTMGTVVGFSNDRKATVYVSAGVKRDAVRFLKSKILFSLDYAPLFFSVLLFYLIKDENFGSVLIDEEYTGKDSFITEKLLLFFNTHTAGRRRPEISFGKIGKHSSAHTLAIRVHRAKGHGAVKISLGQIIALLLKKQAGPKRRTHRVSR